MFDGILTKAKSKTFLRHEMVQTLRNLIYRSSFFLFCANLKKEGSSEGLIGRLVTSQGLLKLPKGRNPPDPVEELVMGGSTLHGTRYALPS